MIKRDSTQVRLLGGGYVYVWAADERDHVQVNAHSDHGPVRSELRMDLSRDEARRIGEALLAGAESTPLPEGATQ